MIVEAVQTPTAIDRARLLPRSGIGVDGAWLVIAPPGNPIIRLDARLLDRVELIGRSPTAPLIASGVATAGVAAAALSLIPGGVFACAGLAYLAHERFSEARRRSRSRDLLLALGDLEVALHVADGPEAAKSVAEQLAPYTRDAPITRPEVYEDAKRRMRAQAEGKGEAAARRELEHALLVGADVVYLRGDYLQVGQVAFRIQEVRTSRSPAVGCCRPRWACSSSPPRNAPRPVKTSRSWRSGSPTTRRGAVTPPVASTGVKASVA